MTNNLAVRVLYFAWLREKIGQPEEQIVLASPISARELVNLLIAISKARRIKRRIFVTWNLYGSRSTKNSPAWMQWFIPVTNSRFSHLSQVAEAICPRYTKKWPCTPKNDSNELAHYAHCAKQVWYLRALFDTKNFHYFCLYFLSKPDCQPQSD